MTADYVIVNADSVEIGAQFVFASGSWLELGQRLSEFKQLYPKGPQLGILSGRSLEKFTRDFAKTPKPVYELSAPANFMAALREQFVASLKAFCVEFGDNKLYVNAADQSDVAHLLVEIGVPGWELKENNVNRHSPDVTLPQDRELMETMIRERMRPPAEQFILLEGNHATGFRAYGPYTKDKLGSEAHKTYAAILTLHPPK